MGYQKMLSKIINKQCVFYPSSDKPHITRYSIFGLINFIAINVFDQSAKAPDDGDYHSHKENFLSVILKGSYKETKIVKGKQITKIFKPFCINRMRYDEYHSVEILTPRVYTLYFRSRPKRKYAMWYNKQLGEMHEIKHWMSKGFNTKQLRDMFNHITKSNE